MIDELRAISVILSWMACGFSGWAIAHGHWDQGTFFAVWAVYFTVQK
jgi:hypothetical protein